MTKQNITIFPHPVLFQPWDDRGSGETGSTEPWTQQFLHSLVLTVGARTIVECGTYLGHTTGWLAYALQSIGGGTLYAIEMDPDRLRQAEEYVAQLPLPDVTMIWLEGDAERVLPTLPDGLDFAWVDDDHDPAHVHTELTLLKPKMAPMGIIAGHDVFGPFGLASVFAAHHGYSLDFPGIHAGRGIGLWQKR